MDGAEAIRDPRRWPWSTRCGSASIGPSAAILTEYRGLTVKDLAALRRSLRDAGGDYRIYKNTLVRFAARDLGLDELGALLDRPDRHRVRHRRATPLPVAKALRDYARTNTKLVVKGGVLGNKVMSAADTTALADLPSRDVVLARLAGALAAPMQQFAGLLQALPRNFAYGLKALHRAGRRPPSALRRPRSSRRRRRGRAAGGRAVRSPAPSRPSRVAGA